jgi:long-chain acyl-CoA synthetase
MTEGQKEWENDPASGGLPIDRLQSTAKRHPKCPALWFQGRKTTYRELLQDVTQAATVLSRFQVIPGDVVGLLLPSSPMLVIYAHAASIVGASIIPLDPTLNDGELTNLVTVGAVQTLVTLDLAETLPIAERLLERGLVQRVLVTPYRSQIPILRAARLTLFQSRLFARPLLNSGAGVALQRDVLKQTVLPRPTATTEPTHPVQLQPAVRIVTQRDDQWWVASLTHDQITHNIAQIIAALPPMTAGEDRILAALPLTCPVGMTAAMHVSIAAGTALICPTDHSAAALVTTIKRAQPSILITTTAILARLAAHPKFEPPTGTDFKFILTLDGDSPPRAIPELARSTRARMITAYVVAKAGAVVAISTGAELAGSSTIGRCLHGTRVVVRDVADLTRVVGAGERGELCISGPQIIQPSHVTLTTKGEKRSGITLPDPSFANGMFRTGDLGTVDAEGQLFLVDRLEDLIVAAGYLIYPRRIEVALRDHEGIDDVAVIGVGERRRGQAPKAFVILKRGKVVTERDLRLHLATRISKIEMPTDIDFCSELPRTPFGSVCKATLRDRNHVR